MTFERWFAQQGFQNFKVEEFLEYFRRKRNGVTNSAPIQSLWENIVPTLRVVDDLRDELGVPITLLSSYRSPAYNQAISGARKSQHTIFKALDISAKGVESKDVHKKLLQWRNEGKFIGGLGLYPNFVHIDTRGQNADW